MKIIWTGGKICFIASPLQRRYLQQKKYGLLNAMRNVPHSSFLSRVAIYQGAQLYRILNFLCNQTPKKEYIT